MLLQTNSYIVPKERRAEHHRLLRRFRQTLARLGCEHFEVYEQVGANWSSGDSTGRFVQIMRFRDRRHQLTVQAAERNDPGAQAVIAEFCNLINFPYQQQQGLFAVGFYTSALPVATIRHHEPAAIEGEQEAAVDEAVAEEGLAEEGLPEEGLAEEGEEGAEAVEAGEFDESGEAAAEEQAEEPLAAEEGAAAEELEDDDEAAGGYEEEEPDAEAVAAVPGEEEEPEGNSAEAVGEHESAELEDEPLEAEAEELEESAETEPPVAEHADEEADAESLEPEEEPSAVGSEAEQVAGESEEVDAIEEIEEAEGAEEAEAAEETELLAEEGEVEIISEQLPPSATGTEEPAVGHQAAGHGAAAETAEASEEIEEVGFEALLSSEQFLQGIDFDDEPVGEGKGSEAAGDIHVASNGHEPHEGGSNEHPSSNSGRNGDRLTAHEDSDPALDHGPDGLHGPEMTEHGAGSPERRHQR